MANVINPQIIPGIHRLSRSEVYARKALIRKTKSAAKPKVVEEEVKPVVKTIGGAKNGGSRTIAKKGPRFYPADDVKKPKPSRKSKTVVHSLRKTITPGTVLILLSGKHQGSRVVFLKQLDSGLLLVTGPHNVNGVALRRVDQAYVIATSTKIDLGSFKVDEKINDTYFKKEKKEVNDDKTKAERVANQKSVDQHIIAAIGKDLVLKAYLKKKFSLDSNQYPHALKF